MATDKTVVSVSAPVFLVGINGANAERVRKVVWWGRIREVMTFAEADARLQGERFQKLREHRTSPLHVRPLFDRGTLVGYRHVSEEHLERNAWVDDLVSPRRKTAVFQDDRTLFLCPGNGPEAFDRDCCILLDNGFFAAGQGLDFDEAALSLLRVTQPGRCGVDHYSVFGKTADGRANGLRGRYLEIGGGLGEQFVRWLEEKTRVSLPEKGDV